MEIKELAEKIVSILDNKKAVDTHGMGWIDSNLYPMFIWDTEKNMVYTCRGLTPNSLLDRRSLRGRFIDHVALSDFLKGVVFASSCIGFQNPKSSIDWFKL